MSWMQVLTKEPLPIEIPSGQKKKQKRKRVVASFPTSIRLTNEHKAKLKKLGGSKWLQQQIDKADV